MTATSLFILGMLVLHVAIVVALFRASMRGEYAARERRRAFRQSLLNRRRP